MRCLFDQEVSTSYGTLELVWEREDGAVAVGTPAVWAGQANQMAGASDPYGVALRLASYSGARVRIEVLDGQPADPDTGWQDVVEVSTTVPTGGGTGVADLGRRGVEPARRGTR